MITTGMIDYLEVCILLIIVNLKDCSLIIFRYNRVYDHALFPIPSIFCHIHFSTALFLLSPTGCHLCAFGRGVWVAWRQWLSHLTAGPTSLKKSTPHFASRMKMNENMQVSPTIAWGLVSLLVSLCCMARTITQGIPCTRGGQVSLGPCVSPRSWPTLCRRTQTFWKRRWKSGRHVRSIKDDTRQWVYITKGSSSGATLRCALRSKGEGDQPCYLII